MNRCSLTADTIPATADVSDTSETWQHLKPVFFGQTVNCPFPADQPLPAHVVIGSTDQTRLEKTPRSR